ncbi:MAG: beta-Ala-His dipeptidase, partial [Desulfatitalea sp.]|nr:beta-Ala-His dipeptidase [Desulfatitalea sp.]NNK00912.1 beta-Ala-His dipeptidase [Desulfatitalea sp.]
GIAIAYAMALAEDETLQRPPLELLFTVDEETGLNGVKNLTSDMIRGRILINLDSEDEGIFTVGCAGGEDTRITLPLQTAALPDRWPVQRIILGGLKGGHSGVDIHKHRANANKLMARVLTALHQHAECRLIDMQGGTRHNAIPRDAEALVAWQPPEPHNLQQVIDQMAAVFRQEYAAVEPSLSVTTAAAPAGTVSTGLDLDSTERAIWLLLALPHGVAGMSSELDGLVETSNNLAKVQLRKDQLCIHTSQRSARTSRLAEMTASIHAVADLAGASVNDENAYPPWPPDMRAPLLEKSKQVYHRMFGTAPVVQVIHAGLECAIIGDRFPGMQMISFGPTIENPHSPSERLNIASVARVWRFLTKLLAELK